MQKIKAVKKTYIPISGAHAPVLGVKKPASIDYCIAYWVKYIPTLGATAPVFGMEDALWK